MATLKTPKIGFQDLLSLNAGQKYCRMLQGDHSAIISTFIKLPFIIKIFFPLILSGRLRQVLLYFMYIVSSLTVNEPRHEISNNVCVCVAVSDQPAQSDQSICKSLEFSMSVKLLTKHHLVFLN